MDKFYNSSESTYYNLHRGPINQISSMVAYWDKDEICRFANTAYFEWFGKTQGEMINSISMQELLGPIYDLNIRFIKRATQGEAQRFEREIKTPHGQTRYSLANYYPDVVDGTVKGFTAHIIDITHIRQLGESFIDHEPDFIINSASATSSLQLDVDYLHQLCQPGSNEFIVEILNAFRNESLKYLNRIFALAGTGDFNGLMKIAHTIKPLGDYIGIGSLRKIVTQLEVAAYQKDSLQIAACIGDLKDQLEAIYMQISLYLQSSNK